MIQIFACVYLVITYIGGLAAFSCIGKHEKFILMRQKEYRESIELQKAVYRYEERINDFFESND